MGSNWMIWGGVLGIVIDVVMIALGWRCIAPLVGQGGHGGQGNHGGSARDAAYAWEVDGTEDSFDFAVENRRTFGLLTNPASGLPMLDDIVDVAGNPYGCDFSHHVETSWADSACDSFGLSSFDSGCGAHDW